MLKTFAGNTQLPESISMSENNFGLDETSFKIRFASKAFVGNKVTLLVDQNGVY